MEREVVKAHVSVPGDQLGCAQVAGLFYAARDHAVVEAVGGVLLRTLLD